MCFRLVTFVLSKQSPFNKGTLLDSEVIGTESHAFNLNLIYFTFAAILVNFFKQG